MSNSAFKSGRPFQKHIVISRNVAAILKTLRAPIHPVRIQDHGSSDIEGNQQRSRIPARFGVDHLGPRQSTQIDHSDLEHHRLCLRDRLTESIGYG
jgi:hypothetical protein